MKLAVAGGTGLVGSEVVRQLGDAGHETVVISRSHGTDTTTGEGLESALDRVEAVVDVTNTPATDAADARAFFTATTRNLLHAERRAGVSHHVLLSIVGLDRVEGNAHYIGKRAQEDLVRAAEVPWTIVRATQFYDFPEMVVNWTRTGSSAFVPPILIQPVAVADLAGELVKIATGDALRRVVEFAGPDRHDFVDMTRRVLSVRGEDIRLIPSWQGTPFGLEMAGDVLLPGPEAERGATTFDAWLELLAS